MEARFVAQGAQPFHDQLAVIAEARVQQAADIFDHHRLGLHFLDDAECRREKIALVRLAALFAGDGEGRARQAGRDEVHAPVRLSVERGDVALNDIPFRPVMAQRAAGIGVDLDQRGVLEPGLLQAQRLAARARA